MATENPRTELKIPKRRFRSVDFWISQSTIEVMIVYLPSRSLIISIYQSGRRSVPSSAFWQIASFLFLAHERFLPSFTLIIAEIMCVLRKKKKFFSARALVFLFFFAPIEVEDHPFYEDKSGEDIFHISFEKLFNYVVIIFVMKSSVLSNGPLKRKRINV